MTNEELNTFQIWGVCAIDKVDNLVKEIVNNEKG